MFDDSDKQLIAIAFQEGKLSTIDGEFIRCDHITPLLVAPVILMGYVLPLPCFIIGFGQVVIRDPAVLNRFYQRVMGTSWIINIVAGILICFAVLLLVYLFVQGWPQIQLTTQSFQEYLRERKTRQYRYGLLLTKHYFGLRCFTSPHQREPLILSRSEITDFYLGSEYSEISHFRNQYIVLKTMYANGKTEQLRLPSANLECKIDKLYSKLIDWFNGSLC